MPIPAFCKRSPFWFAAFLAWATVLWFLSDGPIPAPEGPDLPGLDKLMHFGYFFGGAGLLSAALFLARPRNETPRWRGLIIAVVLTLAAVGLLDEWHQSWVPERNGNDPWDWLADVCGALAGTLVFRRLHHLLL